MTADLSSSQAVLSRRSGPLARAAARAEPAGDHGASTKRGEPGVARPRGHWFPSKADARLLGCGGGGSGSWGAIYLQGGVAALPARVDAERALRKLRHDIVEMSGSSPCC